MQKFEDRMAIATLNDYCEKIDVAGTFENQVLYTMCRDHPEHNNSDVVSGKLIAIGRIYAASPERGAGKAKYGSKTVLDAIANKLAGSELDYKLGKVKVDERLDIKSIRDDVIDIHEWLVQQISCATKEWSANSKDSEWKPKNQVSFASKYLHFHRPSAFPIMDSFAKIGLNCVGQKGAFETYEKFCEAFVRFSNDQKVDSTPRCLDTILVRRGRIHSKRESRPCKCCQQMKRIRASQKNT